mmetsp:Transcript_40828/g.121010  ORF Transcript_40828/g.121010 Transcript_40828/m.121010 type:complete len:446 (-) Transcript_40828:1268-2605(-)
MRAQAPGGHLRSGQVRADLELHGADAGPVQVLRGGGLQRGLPPERLPPRRGLLRQAPSHEFAHGGHPHVQGDPHQGLPGVPLQPRRAVLRGRQRQLRADLQDLHLRAAVQPARPPVEGSVGVLDRRRLPARDHGRGRRRVRVRPAQGGPQDLRLVAEGHQLLVRRRPHDGRGQRDADEHRDHVRGGLGQDAQRGAGQRPDQLPGGRRHAGPGRSGQRREGALRRRRGAGDAGRPAVLQLPARRGLRRVPGALAADHPHPRLLRRAVPLHHRRGRLPLHLRHQAEDAREARQGRHARLRGRDPGDAGLPGRQAGGAPGPGAPGRGAHEQDRVPAEEPRQLPQGEDGGAPGEVQRGDRHGAAQVRAPPRGEERDGGGVRGQHPRVRGAAQQGHAGPGAVLPAEDADRGAAVPEAGPGSGAREGGVGGAALRHAERARQRRRPDAPRF